MVQELKFSVAIVGAGPAGCLAAYFLQNGSDVTIFDFGITLRTLLPTGGGRCNLGHAEFDFKELAKNYPRGERFLYSVFSKFATGDTLEFFQNIGVDTYVQDDNRVFPTSDSAEKVRERMLSSIKKSQIVREKVLNIEKISSGFKLKTDKSTYLFDKVLISTGGHASFDIAKTLGHTIVEPKPSLVGIKTDVNFSSISGVCLKNVTVDFNGKSQTGDLLFTHKGLSGPVIYRMTSVMARANYPYNVKLRFCEDVDLQNLLNSNPHKSIKNLIAELVPRSLAEFLLAHGKINPDLKCHRVDGKIRDQVLTLLYSFDTKVKESVKDSEVVTSGGIALDEVNPKNMESKIVPKLHFAGEVLDIDGFCGGFNLQNCWSTAFVASEGMLGHSLLL